MNIVYKNQSYSLTLNTDSTLDFATASITHILYVKPDETKGFFDATVLAGNKLTYEVASNENDQDGLWKFQAYVEFASGKKYFGKITELNILNNLL
jgi:hypothetical protein